MRLGPRRHFHSTGPGHSDGGSSPTPGLGDPKLITDAVLRPIFAASPASSRETGEVTAYGGGALVFRSAGTAAATTLHAIKSWQKIAPEAFSICDETFRLTVRTKHNE